MNKIFFIGLGMLLIGLGVGYGVADLRQPAPMVHDMNSTMVGMTSGLGGKDGEEFEKAFIEEMIVHHEGAVAMAKEVQAKSKRPELLQLANEIISAQTKEIGMMRSWLEKWF